jgi:Fur family peroxide stress response transcriptional regulator
MNKIKIKNKLIEKGLRVTPQRLAIYEAICLSDNHPTVENIIEFIKEHHPTIATGTVYKVLDTFIEKKIIVRVKTEKDTMRYDAILEKHHHLYSLESDRILDYFNDDLDKMLEDYFNKHKIAKFEINDIKLQIIGKFK